MTAHKALAEAPFQQQKLDRAEARNEELTYFITYDMEMTLSLPKLTVSKAFYLRQLWLYNTGVHLISKDKEGVFFHVWTEDQGGRGVKEVTSCLLSFITTRVSSQLVKRLTRHGQLVAVFCDELAVRRLDRCDEFTAMTS